MTKIEWTGITWNPVTGCTKVSEGCRNCYAERMANGLLRGRHGYPADEPFRVTIHEDRLHEPEGYPKGERVFVCSMGDLFHVQVPERVQRQVWKMAESRPDLTFQVLTKRAERMRRVVSNLCDVYGVLENVWLGVTVENGAAADERILPLLDTPAAVRFLSCEPLLVPLHLCDVYRGYLRPLQRDAPGAPVVSPGIDWLIIGCESGPKRRPCEMEWVRDLIGQAYVADVSVFVKQLDIDGKVSKEPDEWPEWARRREFPETQ